MRESARVLKRGGRFYGLETVRLPNYEKSDAGHVLTQRSNTISGGNPVANIMEALNQHDAKMVGV